MGERILQANRVDVAIGPQVLGTDTTVSSGWFSMREWAELAAVLLLKGVLMAGDMVTLALRQATSAAGAGAKALASKVVMAGAAAGNLLLIFDPVRRAVITLDTVVETDAVTVDGGTTLTFVGSVHRITLGTVVATDAVTVGASTFTFVADDPQAGDVLLGANNEAAATNLATAISALEGCEATAAGAVVTVVGASAAQTITTDDTTITVAAAAFAGGAVSKGASDAEAAANLAAAISPLEGYAATAAGAVVTVLGDDLNVATDDTTITILMSAVADGDAVEVNGETLTFKATGTGTGGAAAAGEVLLGADDDDAAANLADAISLIEGLTAVDTAAAGENPASVAVAASVPAGVTVDLGDTTIWAVTTEDIVTLGLDVSALDVNAGFAFVQVQATASGDGLTGAATLLRGGGRVAVRQDV